MPQRPEPATGTAVTDAPSAGVGTGIGLRRFHWCVVALSLLLTLLASALSARALEQRNAQRFGRQADKVIDQLVEQLQRHADVLAAGAGLVMASEEVTREEWRRFAATLDLEGQFPALTGIGVAYRVPAASAPDFVARQRESRPDFALRPPSEGSEHLAVVHVTPARLASSVEGLDLAVETHRREAAARAAARARAQLTAPVTLTASDAPGVVMLVPFYRDGPDVPPAEREERFAGAVVATMLLENLVAGTLDRNTRQIRLRVADGGALLHDELGGTDADIDPEPLHTLVRDVPVHGRRWSVEVHSTLAFRREANLTQPLLMLGGGLCIDLLLFALLWMHTRSERRLRGAADELHEHGVALARSNEKLEAFACIASHDLKTPLRGVRTLVEFVEEDLYAHFGGEGIARDTVPDIVRNLADVHRQVSRADALIEGVLAYSGLGNGDEPVERTDTRTLIAEIGETLQVDGERLVAVEPLPVFKTNATRLRQVLTNLIGNAFKYHDDPDGAHVRVTVETVGDCYRFSVSDDGPGIDPRYHECIFEPFGKGHEAVRTDSTGVGLAIVRESVVAMGGTISLDSSPGRGATFVFDWPRSAVDGDDADAVAGADHDAGRELPAVGQRAA